MLEGELKRIADALELIARSMGQTRGGVETLKQEAKVKEPKQMDLPMQEEAPPKLEDLQEEKTEADEIIDSTALTFPQIKSLNKEEVIYHLTALGIKSFNPNASMASLKRMLADKIEAIKAGKIPEPPKHDGPLNTTKEWNTCKDALLKLSKFGSDKVFALLNSYGVEKLGQLQTVAQLIDLERKALTELKKHE